MSTATKATSIQDLPSPYERRIGHETVYTRWIGAMLRRNDLDHLEPLHVEAWMRVKYPDLDLMPEHTSLDEILAAARLVEAHPGGTEALIAVARSRTGGRR